MDTKNTRTASFSIDKEVREEFIKACKDNAINQSKYVEMKMKELIESLKKN